MAGPLSRCRTSSSVLPDFPTIPASPSTSIQPNDGAAPHHEGRWNSRHTSGQLRGHWNRRTEPKKYRTLTSGRPLLQLLGVCVTPSGSTDVGNWPSSRWLASPVRDAWRYIVRACSPILTRGGGSFGLEVNRRDWSLDRVCRVSGLANPNMARDGARRVRPTLSLALGFRAQAL